LPAPIHLVIFYLLIRIGLAPNYSIFLNITAEEKRGGADEAVHIVGIYALSDNDSCGISTSHFEWRSGDTYPDI
jgi:hypothetical protein